jgi:hypothetical protein
VRGERADTIGATAPWYAAPNLDGTVVAVEEPSTASIASGRASHRYVRKTVDRVDPAGGGGIDEKGYKRNKAFCDIDRIRPRRRMRSAIRRPNKSRRPRPRYIGCCQVALRLLIRECAYGNSNSLRRASRRSAIRPASPYSACWFEQGGTVWLLAKFRRAWVFRLQRSLITLPCFGRSCTAGEAGPGAAVQTQPRSDERDH